MSEQVGKNHASFTLDAVRVATGAVGEGQGSATGVVTDSRQLEAGNLFVALRGERFDANQFLEAALETGAHVLGTRLVTPAFEKGGASLQVADTLVALGDLARFHRQRFTIPIVAVTGSYGKTSTRALIAAALRTQFETLASEGNFNNEIGLPMTLFQLEEKHEMAVVEMGMRGLGQIESLAKIAEPTVGVITNIGPQHIELLGTEENIAVAKAELLESLSVDSLAVLPANSPWLESLKAKTLCHYVTFGTDVEADYRVQSVRTNAEGTVSFDLNFPANIGGGENQAEREVCTVQLPLPGAHNATNAAAAFAVAHQLGVRFEKIVQGLEQAELPGARMRVVHLPNGTTVIDDCYNAGPTSTRAALQTLLDFPGSGRRVAILGAMRELGEHSEVQHAGIGRFAGMVCDVLVGVDGETRPLLNAAVASAKEVENEMKVSWCDNAAEAAARVGEWVQPGDVVLVKGSHSIGLETVVEALGRES